MLVPDSRLEQAWRRGRRRLRPLTFGGCCSIAELTHLIAAIILRSPLPLEQVTARWRVHGRYRCRRCLLSLVTAFLVRQLQTWFHIALRLLIHFCRRGQNGRGCRVHVLPLTRGSMFSLLLVVCLLLGDNFIEEVFDIFLDLVLLAGRDSSGILNPMVLEV